MVRAVVGGEVTKDLLLFTPELTQPDLSMEDGAFQLESGKCLNVIMAQQQTMTDLLMVV